MGHDMKKAYNMSNEYTVYSIFTKGGQHYNASQLLE